MPTYEDIMHKALKEKKINIINPVTIQDKINWLKFHDSTPLKGMCADKIAVHEYVKSVLGKDICVPIIAVYDSVKQINPADLPNKFVMKTNHGYSMNLICRDKEKFDFASAKTNLVKWMKTDFGLESGQPHYSYITPKIFVEELLEDDRQKVSLFDYKFWCFNGEPKLWTMNDGNGHGDIVYYDMDDNVLDLYQTGSGNKYEKPSEFELMKDYARKLSKAFDFVRVDFYEVNGRVYLGELTFTPGRGLFRYKKKGADEFVGNMLTINTNKKYEEGVSVCLTAYNAQDFIEETLDSIEKQTWFKKHDNWEVILGIDGCMDTLKKVRSIMKKYRNLRVLMMNSNCGTYVTTNTVMSEAKYSGLIRFDSDDIMMPDLVESIMERKGDSDLLNFKFEYFGQKKGSAKSCGQVWMKHSVFDKFGGYLPWTCSADSDIECRIRKFCVLKTLGKVLFRRRIHGNNLTTKNETSTRSTLRQMNLRYSAHSVAQMKTIQDAVVVKFTSQFTEISSPDTPFVPSAKKFKKLDVVYQEHKENMLPLNGLKKPVVAPTEIRPEIQSIREKKTFSQPVVHAEPPYNVELYKKIIGRTAPSVRKKIAATKIMRFLNSN